MPMKRRLIQIARISPFLLILAVLALRCGRTPGGYLNLAPDVAYTGNASCESCHKKIAQSYRETGMGRSLYRPARDQIIETFTDETVVYDPHSDYAYHPYWSGDQMYIREFRLSGSDTTYRRDEEVDYIVGSGHQTRSYLLNRNDYLYEAPITWYVNKQIWDLSPGYEDGHNSRFTREIGEECMACHTGNFTYVEGSKNRFHDVGLGIDCERCHGPGSAHIEAIEGGQLIDVGEEIDYTIVNPGKLPIGKQFDVCQQCHLQGVNVFRAGKSIRDFRPGMSLREVLDIFIERQEDPEAFGIASHAERLQASQCFIESAGRLTCTTCHDPHKSISVTDSLVYIRQCTGCHQAQKQPLCAAPAHQQAEMGGNCISCHMPGGGTSDIPHVSFHDHKIRVVREAGLTVSEEEKDFLRLVCATDSAPSADIQGRAWLQYFERHAPDTANLRRAASLLDPGNDSYQARLAYYQGDFEAALRRVEALLAQAPEKAEILFLQGEILEASGRYNRAYESYRKVWDTNPEMVEAGLKSGTTLLRARQGDREVLPEAQAIFEQLRIRKPFDVRILSNLGFVWLNQGDLKQAESALVQALSYDPDYQQALENMVYLQLLKRNQVLARQYLDRLTTVAPAHPRREVLEGQVKPKEAGRH